MMPYIEVVGTISTAVESWSIVGGVRCIHNCQNACIAFKTGYLRDQHSRVKKWKDDGKIIFEKLFLSLYKCRLRLWQHVNDILGVSSLIYLCGMICIFAMQWCDTRSCWWILKWVRVYGKYERPSVYLWRRLPPIAMMTFWWIPSYIHRWASKIEL